MDDKQVIGSHIYEITMVFSGSVYNKCLFSIEMLQHWEFMIYYWEYTVGVGNNQ